MKRNFVAAVLSALLLLASSVALADTKDFFEKELQNTLNVNDVTEIVDSWVTDFGGTMTDVQAVAFMKEVTEEMLKSSDEDIAEAIGDVINEDPSVRLLVKYVGVRRVVKFWWECADYYEKEVIAKR